MVVSGYVYNFLIASNIVSDEYMCKEIFDKYFLYTLTSVILKIDAIMLLSRFHAGLHYAHSIHCL